MKNLQDKTKILLIENNSDWLADVCPALEEAGYDVSISTGGDKGFCVARRWRPDLIICEAALAPDISSVQLCYMIRADRDLQSALFVLIGEASAQNCDAALEGFRAGADDYLDKSCHPQLLSVKIERLIRLRRSEAALRQGYENLYRSELYLAKLIEETAGLAGALNPVSEIDDFDELVISKSEKQTDVLETWKEAIQDEEFVHANYVKKEGCEVVYYEIVL